MNSRIKLVSVFASFAYFASVATALSPAAQASDGFCPPVRIAKEIERPAGELVLADLLPANACPAMASAARQIHLGRVPLAGSPRVLSGDEVRAALLRLVSFEPSVSFELMDRITVPERVTVRRRVAEESDAGSSAGSGAASSASPATSVRMHGHGAGSGRLHARDDELVRAGQKVTLIWDQGGIRVQVTALCLEPGGSGSQVRARILQTGAVVRATVVGAGSLRVIS